MDTLISKVVHELILAKMAVVVLLDGLHIMISWAVQRTYTNASGYQFPYTGWGDVLFYNHGGWGNGSIYHSPNSGHYKGSSGNWTSTGGLWIR